jgi:hypothetical protein
MADVASTGTPSLATLTPPPGTQLTKEAAVDMVAGQMVYITSADKFDLTNGTANDALAVWWGMVLRTAKAGQPVTAHHSVEVRFAAALTVGARYYVSTTVGALSDAATTGGTVPCAQATSVDKIYIRAPQK